MQAIVWTDRKGNMSSDTKTLHVNLIPFGGAAEKKKFKSIKNI